MTDFLQDEDVAAFSAEVRAFLAENMTDEMRRRIHDTGTVHDPTLHADMAAHGWMATATSKASMDHLRRFCSFPHGATLGPVKESPHRPWT